MGSGSFFGRNTLLLRENEAAENVPDPLVFRENFVCPVNGYNASYTNSAIGSPSGRI